ncbi:hypothetical protein DSM3645_17160 [Blastopirellula marina DSM 3645]|uniref:Uncharacterized protein n=1 Tax=Blastopirellula marina DSM 3645 TaxID=314230 RepID=A3ZNK7_9BACT|nr:hypothetical protein DSM3645_17160 [Blastopirellula marina DSM 3645]
MPLGGEILLVGIAGRLGWPLPVVFCCALGCGAWSDVLIA